MSVPEGTCARCGNPWSLTHDCHKPSVIDDGDVRILCACGCGELVASLDVRGRPRRFKRGHNARTANNYPSFEGRRHTDESRRLLSLAAQARASSTTPAAGRAKAQRRIPMPDLCQRCEKVPPYDRHHIDGNTHNNDPANVLCLCRRCHQTIDGRLARLTRRNREGVS